MDIALQTRKSYVIRGAVALLFGLFMLTYPHFTLSILVIIFGIYVFASGLMTTLLALFSREHDMGWWIYFMEGSFGMFLGILIFSLPDITVIVFLYLMALWAMLTGVMQVVAYVKLYRIFENEILLCVSGLLSIVIGMLLFRFPIQGTVMIAWILGFYAFVFGLLSILTAVRMK